MFGKRGGKDEWIGGVRTLSTPVTGEGEPYRPIGLLWMDSKAGTLVGMSVEHPDAGLAHAADHLLGVIAEPMDGNPRRPRRIRTASGALAEALATGLADARPPIEIVVAPTPELDEAYDGVEAMLAARGEAPDGAPADPSSTVPHDAASLIDALHELKAHAAKDELDVDEAQRLTEALFERFRESVEAAPFENPLQGPELLARTAALQLDTTLPALTGQELDEALLEIVPRTVSAPPDIARGVIETTRALFAWLGREHDLERADELIELLGEDAVRELERRLDEPEAFGPAKALMMEAMAEGVDLSDPKAIDDFMMSRLRSDPRFGPDDPFGDFDDFPPVPSAPPLTPEQRRAKQKKRKGNRKAARKARKKNR